MIFLDPLLGVSVLFLDYAAFMRLLLFFSFAISKVSRETLYDCVRGVLEQSETKKRKFLETVELQIVLKNYDPQKDKRFSGTVK